MGNLVKADWHIDAFNYFVKFPNYKAVAKQFGKSISTIQKWSTFYGWQKKRMELLSKDDNSLTGQFDINVSESRKESIRHGHLVRMWQKGLDEIHQRLISEKRDASPEEKKEMERFRAAIEDSNTKIARDVTDDIKQNVMFYPPKQLGKLIPPDGESQVGEKANINNYGPTLMLVAPPGSDLSKNIVGKVEEKNGGEAPKQPL